MHNWKMRWVMLQAGCVWYFRDQSRKEQLGMMALAGSEVRGATADNPRHLQLVSEERTLHLIAADQTEALGWLRVLKRAIEEVNQRSDEGGKGPMLVAGFEQLLSPLLDVKSGDLSTLSPLQEHSLSVVLLTLHSIASPGAVATELQRTYDRKAGVGDALLSRFGLNYEQQPLRRRVAYMLLRCVAHRLPPSATRARPPACTRHAQPQAHAHVTGKRHITGTPALRAAAATTAQHALARAHTLHASLSFLPVSQPNQMGAAAP